MRKKHWIIGLMALLALVVGVGSGTALAQENGEKAEKPIQGVIARVATILGLEEQQVQAAFDQARQEIRDARFEEMVGQRLDALVESGRITQEQADEMRAWYAERPDSFWLAAGSDRGKGFGRHGGRGKGHFSFKGNSFHRGDCSGKGETAPATSTPEAPAATPTAPADSSDDN
ncbi:MAG: hypothetical protein OXM03_09260 [Chloroflexota bacterium]|nr:hypothetical protein [Chloroflexota bacterium]MDE2840801.1 hypothetical protein [Chloroflexota bacterium]MDE2929491.1 hypothetical protein [Chloroflexota bacterium]